MVVARGGVGSRFAMGRMRSRRSRLLCEGLACQVPRMPMGSRALLWHPHVISAVRARRPTAAEGARLSRGGTAHSRKVGGRSPGHRRAALTAGIALGGRSCGEPDGAVRLLLG